MPLCPEPSRRRGFLAVVIAVPLAFALGCGNAEDSNVIRLSEETPALTPAVEDVQSDAAVNSDVDLAFSTFDGDTRNFTAYAGTPLIINFFARSCPACVSEMPEFDQVFREFDGAAAFVGISTDPRLDDAKSLADETGVSYDLAWDPDGDLFQHFGGFAMPTTVFVDSEGTVQETWSGVLTPADLTSKIEALG